MSSLRRCAVEVKTVNENLVRETMQNLATFLTREGYTGVQMVDKIGSYDVRQMTHVMTGITSEEIRGFGVKVEGGKLIIIGDDYRQRLSIEAFKTMFHNFYIANVMQKSLQAMGYTTNANILENKTIAVRGVSGVGYVE